MPDESVPTPEQPVPETPPAPVPTDQAPAAAPTPTDESTMAPPGPGEDALHYAGTEPLSVEGLTFAPDSLTILPAEMAARLAGTHDLRMVQETAESWPHYLAIRARARAGRSG